MGYALQSSVSASGRAWHVLLINDEGRCCGKLPCACESEAEAEAYAKAIMKLRNH